MAADRQASAGGWNFEVCKIRRLTDGRLVAGAGEFAFVLAMYAWLEAGGDPASFPDAQRDREDWEPILVVAPTGKLLRYERTPYPMPVEAPFYAAGSGRDYALMAMHLGKSAPEAVHLASVLDPGTGLGVDTLTLEHSSLVRTVARWPGQPDPNP